MTLQECQRTIIFISIMTQYFNKNTRWALMTHQGHTYLRKPKTKNKWKCLRSECPGEVDVFRSQVYQLTLHNHPEEYNRIAAEFVKEKLVEWGAWNYEIRQTKQLDVIFGCLSPNVLFYMPGKSEIMCLIKSKQRRRRATDLQQPQQQKEFVFSLHEIKDFKVAELLSQSDHLLHLHYAKCGIIQSTNINTDFNVIQTFQNNLQQQYHKTSDSVIGITVPNYGSNICCNNNISLFDKEMTQSSEINDYNNNSINVQQLPCQTASPFNFILTESDESVMDNNNIASSPLIFDQQMEISFDDDFDYGNNEKQGPSSANINSSTPISNTVINEECISLFETPPAKKIPTTNSRLEKAINRLYQRQQQQHCDITSNTNDEYLSSTSNQLSNIITANQACCSGDKDTVDNHNFVEYQDILNVTETSDSFINENNQISNQLLTFSLMQNKDDDIFRAITSNNNLLSIETTTENQNPEIILTDITLLSILLNPDEEDRIQKLNEYERKVLAELEETSKITKNILDDYEQRIKYF